VMLCARLACFVTKSINFPGRKHLLRTFGVYSIKMARQMLSLRVLATLIVII
jgi:hypothetical protein